VALGSAVQTVLMLLKIGAIGGLIFCGLFLAPAATTHAAPALPGAHTLAAFGAAMGPVLFAYGGWQTSSFISGELKDPQRDLPRGLLFGVAGVIALYLGVNWVCVRVLGLALAATLAPASEVMQRALGPIGARLIEAGIAISTLGFLSQSMLTAPRVYYAMAKDGVFIERVGRLDPRTRVPVVAIALQGAFAMLLTAWGQYRQILDFMIAIDFLAFGFTAAAVFVFRRRDPQGAKAGAFQTPGHPWTTGLFVAACFLFVLNLMIQRPEALVGLAVLLTGVPAYLFWTRAHRRRAA
jgi:APA family basic amino acid/polyamine antiporter